MAETYALDSELDTLLPEDISVPEAVRIAQQDTISSAKKEQKYNPRVHLFFSFDIVNSTSYKNLTTKWPLIIKNLLDRIRTAIQMTSCLSMANLWRVIGDEIVFVMPIQHENELEDAVSELFEVTTKISFSIKCGKFFDTLENQEIEMSEIQFLKTQSPLSIKAAAWLAVINDRISSPYDSIYTTYASMYQGEDIKEYLGKDIDTGFRLKSYTQDRRLVLSFELAYLIEKRAKNKLCILDYVRLKGVWNDALYPITWYHDSELYTRIYEEAYGIKGPQPITFSHSFRYDETDNNDLAKSYFSRLHISKKRKNATRRASISGFENSAAKHTLADSMYSPNSAFPKVLADRNLAPKIEYIRSFFSDDVAIRNQSDYVYPLELHFAVVCCDVKNRKILVTKRGTEHSTNPGKWEFGCAKAQSESELILSIVRHYKTAFGVDIEILVDETRSDKQPIPLSIYEIPKHGSWKKGVIIVARVKDPESTKNFRPEAAHTCIRWIGEEEISTISSEDAIPDFHNTINRVFENFDKYFALE